MISDHPLRDILPENAAVDQSGLLSIGGCDATELAVAYGTPLIVIDEDGLRRQARRFADGLAARWTGPTAVLFASKSLPIVAAYQVARDEGLCVDVAGAGELVMALAAGVPAERIYLHGNAKTDDEIRRAVEAGVGGIVADNFDDLDRIERHASPSAPVPVMVRVIPGIDAPTHESQATGGSASKFGLPTDQAAEAFARIRASDRMRLLGVHLHIGSQILDVEPFAEAVEAAAGVGGFDAYDVGGGLGVRYTRDEASPSVEEYLDTLAEAAHGALPADATLMIEPGRSLVARSALTLYTVTTVKRTSLTFVAVDGGMADNLEVSLTGQQFEACLPARMAEPAHERVRVVGRQCESGDVLIEEIDLPRPRVGDLLAITTTGAYTYTMSNNYNGALKPAVVMCSGGSHRLVVRRQTHADLLDLNRPALLSPAPISSVQPAPHQKAGTA